MSAECRATDEGYLRNGEHYDDCEDTACRGCYPCVPEHGAQHCTARKKCAHHVSSDELTCPRCLGKTRDDLAALERMDALMPHEAEECGVDSEAAMLAGPAADAAGWSARKVYAGRMGTKALMDDDDPHHPLMVLGRWDFMLREDYDQPTKAKVTVARSVAYLDGQLDRFAQDDEQDFPLFVREVAACRSHLESVLRDSRSPERGAPCHLCPPKKAPRLILKHDDRDLTGASDRWCCPDCKNSWSDAEYRLRVGKDYLENATALTASQIKAQYRVPEGRVRKWAERGKVRKRGTDPQGRMLYDVEDVKTMRDSGEAA